MAPVPSANKIAKNGVAFLNSMMSRKMQKKQNLPRSNNIPREIPINNEIDLVLPFSPADKRYARMNRAIRINAERPALSLSAFVQTEPDKVPLEGSTALCFRLICRVIRPYPKLFRLG